MTIQNCIKFTNEHPFCYLATCDNGQPRVRAMGFWFADQTGFYFQSGTIKALVGQLERNPRAEACFYHHHDTMGTMLRISGEVEFLDDRALKERCLEERPFLRQMGMTADGQGLVIFRIAHGEADFWTMDTNLAARNPIKF